MRHKRGELTLSILAVSHFTPFLPPPSHLDFYCRLGGQRGAGIRGTAPIHIPYTSPSNLTMHLSKMPRSLYQNSPRLHIKQQPHASNLMANCCQRTVTAYCQ